MLAITFSLNRITLITCKLLAALCFIFTNFAASAAPAFVQPLIKSYHPGLGRFMGVDPVGYQEANIHSSNRYAYANNNPYKYVDPDGRSAVSVLAGVGVLVIGGAYYALAPPGKQQEMRESVGRLARAIGSVLQSESAGAGDGAKGEPKKGADSGTRETPIPGATGGERFGNGPRIWDKPSANPVGDSNGDFDRLFPNGDGVSDKGNGVRIGTEPDGGRVIVRPGSSDASNNSRGTLCNADR